jgi:predicted acyl esterase
MKDCIYAVIRCFVPGLVLLSGVLRGADVGDDKAGDTNAFWVAQHYTKYEHRIPMRDGVRLFTRVYVPKDDSQRWPIILTRTP